MNSELHSLSQIFQDKLFRIPDYQRGYSWGNPQLLDFWEDLINIPENHFHYTGLLSIKKLTRAELLKESWLLDQGIESAYHVIDGQQRLTTAMLLLNEIILFAKNLQKNKNKPDRDIFLTHYTLETILSKYICRTFYPSGLKRYLFDYQENNSSHLYLQNRIFEFQKGKDIPETFYTRNLENAKKFFAYSVKEYVKKHKEAGLENLFDKLTRRLKFNIHEIGDEYDVFVAFETMNNRGKKLSNLELLKNRLIYLTTLYDDKKLRPEAKQEYRSIINQAWETIYAYLGKNPLRPLADDEFLRTHWILYYTYSRKRGSDYINFLLNKFAPNHIFEYSASLPPALEEATFSPSQEEETEDENETELLPAVKEPEPVSGKLAPQEIINYVESLQKTAKYWYDSFFPEDSQTLSPDEKLWIDRLNRIDIGYFRPLVTAILYREDFTPQQRAACFKAIERFLFIFFRMSSYYTASRSSSEFYRAARDIYKGNLSIEKLTQYINEKTNAALPECRTAFLLHSQKRFQEYKGFYEWRPLRYFFYEYEYVLGQQKGISKISKDMFTRVEKDKISIEHIFPQTPNLPYWTQRFGQFSPEKRLQIGNAIGNLLLLSQSINSSLQNDSFPDKKNPPANKRRGYVNGSHAEIEVAQEAEWTLEQILARSKKLLAFMSKRWELELTDEQISLLTGEQEFKRWLKYGSLSGYKRCKRVPPSKGIKNACLQRF